MPRERRLYEIDKDTYIVDSSGVAPEGERMRRQANHSMEVVRGWFESGALRLVPSTDKKEAEQQSKPGEPPR